MKFTKLAAASAGVALSASRAACGSSTKTVLVDSGYHTVAQLQ